MNDANGELSSSLRRTERKKSETKEGLDRLNRPLLCSVVLTGQQVPLYSGLLTASFNGWRPEDHIDRGEGDNGNPENLLSGNTEEKFENSDEWSTETEESTPSSLSLQRAAAFSPNPQEQSAICINRAERVAENGMDDDNVDKFTSDMSMTTLTPTEIVNNRKRKASMQEKKAVVNETSSGSLNIRLSGVVHHKTYTPTYDVSWAHRRNWYGSATDRKDLTWRLMATCSGKYIFLYTVSFDNGKGSVPHLWEVLEIPGSYDSELYCCCFAEGKGNQDGGYPHQLVCAGGSQKCVLVYDIKTQQVRYNMSGHVGDILDMKCCPREKWLLATASGDNAIRLWNLNNGDLIAILCGRGGHRDKVLSLSWHDSGSFLASGGYDRTVKVWDTGEKSTIRDFVKESNAEEQVTGALKTARIEGPAGSTNLFHLHCVDCVNWVGNSILAKSIERRIELIHPCIIHGSDGAQVCSFDLIRTFDYSNQLQTLCLWYCRFAVHPSRSWLATGDSDGILHIWSIHDNPGEAICTPMKKIDAQKLGPRALGCIRGMEFSPCGNMLAVTADNSCTYVWDFKCQ